MPGPPPPPPNMMAPPPPPGPMPFQQSGKPDDRAALLKSIQKGAKLKKTVTNDKSAPRIDGRNDSSSGVSPSSGASTPNGLNLGGLFAGGMPKLKPTGKLSSVNQNSTTNVNNSDNHINRRPFPSQQIKNSSSLQNELKKQMASDNRSRGPPPPAPVRNTPQENGSVKTFPVKGSSTNKASEESDGLWRNGSVKVALTNELNSNRATVPLHLQINKSTLHRKVKSNTNLTNSDSPDSVNGFNQATKPVISHGKPNLAPKPPLNAKPIAPPKKLLTNGKAVSRAHSMKSPRSPSPQSPDTNPHVKFGTVRNLSSVIGQSLANSTGNLSPRPRPAINGRPNAPPPSIPTQLPPPPPPHANPAPLPPSKTGYVKPPSHAPPPPPTSTPPPPPHRRAPIIPSNGNLAPPPPPRHSSMTSNRSFDEKFKNMFKDPSTFPKPPPYRNIIKLYGGKQAGNKQQAPQPPNLQSTSRTWDASSAC